LPTLAYSTYLGGSGTDFGYGIAVDSSGNAYVTGLTYSSNFPTTHVAFQTSLAGTYNTFVTKLNPTGTALVYSTYLGGTSGDAGYGIAVDSSGHTYVTGNTTSTSFPTTAGAFQTSLPGVQNAFVTKLNPAGSALVYSTYLGGSNTDVGYGIAVDSSGHTYVTGNTTSTSFPTTARAFQTALAGISDVFVTKLATTTQAQIVDLERSVQALVFTGTLSPGEGQSLLAPLNATMAAVAHANTATAIEQLDEFIARVQSLEGYDVL
jgi:hypothetical protein